MATNAVKMITLKSSDGKEFIVPEAVAMMSQSIRHLIEDNCADNSIPLANVNSMTLAKVIEYCMKHVSIKGKNTDPFKPKKTEEGCATDAETLDTMSPEAELKKWDAEFLNIDNDTLYYLILAANFLDNKDLLDLTCQKVANMIKSKSPEEIRKTFDIKNDFTPEEEEEIRRDNGWAFE